MVVLSDGHRNCHQQTSRPMPVTLQLCSIPCLAGIFLFLKGGEEASFSFMTLFPQRVRGPACSTDAFVKAPEPLVEVDLAAPGVCPQLCCPPCGSSSCPFLQLASLHTTLPLPLNREHFSFAPFLHTPSCPTVSSPSSRKES